MGLVKVLVDGDQLVEGEFGRKRPLNWQKKETGDKRLHRPISSLRQTHDECKCA